MELLLSPIHQILVPLKKCLRIITCGVVHRHNDQRQKFFFRGVDYTLRNMTATSVSVNFHVSQVGTFAANFELGSQVHELGYQVRRWLPSSYLAVSWEKPKNLVGSNVTHVESNELL